MNQLSNNFTTWMHRRADSEASFVFSDSVRSPSLSRLSDGIFPTRKDEEWRYTPLASILESSPDPVVTSLIDASFVSNLKVAVPDAHTIVFVNGTYSEEYSDDITENKAAGISITHLAQLEEPALKTAEHIILNSNLTDDNIFQHIALGLSQAGLFIEVAKNVDCETLIHIIHISTAQSAPAFTNPVNVVRLENNSHLKIVEQYATQGDAAVVTIPANYIEIDDGAGLDYYRIGIENAETQHVSNISVRIGKSGSLNSHQYLLGSNLTRSNLEVSFTGPGAEAALLGVYLGDDNQHLDVRTYLDHAHPHCSSNQHFRGILNGHSRGVFNGLVLVREHAQKTDARQSNKNLLLSKDARVDTKPQLEIFADDVKCAHGATVGELDTNALFYLQSRGIDKKDATLMLTRAFASEVTQEIKIESLQSYVQDIIAASLDKIVTTSV